MNKMQIYNNPEFGAIRTIEENGEAWFVGKDVAAVLGYADCNRAVNQHVDREDRKALGRKDWGDLYPALWGNDADLANKVLVNESCLYSLVMRSDLPSAKKFRRWVTNEVLPSIRKHGMYATPNTVEAMLADPDTAIKLLTSLKEEREARQALEKQAEKDKPKVLFADAVSASHSSILVGELAKLLKQNGVDMGQNRLFQWMRGNGYLINRRGSDYNMPTQRSMDLELFTIKETAITHSNGSVSVSKTVKVTGKGQQYFVNKFLGQKEEKESEGVQRF